MGVVVQCMVQYTFEEKNWKVQEQEHSPASYHIGENKKCVSVATKEDYTYHGIMKEPNVLNESRVWMTELYIYIISS